MKPSLALLLAKPTRPPAEIMAMFANGQKGAILIPSLSKYAFQDAAKTIPAAVGMPLTKLVCPATGVEATFANVTLQVDSNGCKYIASNGSTSGGSTPAINFTGTDKMTVLAGIEKSSDVAGSVIELSANPAGTAGAFWINTAAAAADDVAFSMSASGVGFRTGYSATGFSAPSKMVFSCVFDFAGASRATEIFPRVNGAIPSLTGTLDATAGTASFGNLALYLLQRNLTSQSFNGKCYGWIICGAALTAGQIADAERYMASLSGVNL